MPDYPCCYATAQGVVYDVVPIFMNLSKILGEKKFFEILKNKNKIKIKNNFFD